MRKVVLIVDAYSAGNLLAKEFRRRGYDCVHLQSTKEILPILKKSFVESDFEANFAFTDDVDHTLRQFRKMEICAVLPGTETGVLLADTISEALHLKSNGTQFSRARRNKFFMIETLRAAGLAVARQKKSSYAQDLVAFKNDIGLSKVVVKPVESAGAEDVRMCEGDGEIVAAHEAIVGKFNMLGLRNQESIVQEFLAGTEYFVNCVSLNGEHVVCDLWRHNKRQLNGFDFVYDRAELCDGQNEDEQAIIRYTKRALDALSISFGPSHSEVILTSDGPRLVEMGARLQGMSWPDLNLACIGFGPVDLTVDCYVDEPEFLRKAQDYHIKRYAMRVNLISSHSGKLKFFDVEKLKSLSSFFYVRPIAEVGACISETINYFTVPGFVMLVSKEREQLQDDYQRIRAWEEQGKILIYEA